MARNAEDIFQQMGIEGGAEAVTHAAATFIRLHPLYFVPPSSKDLSEHELEVLEEGGFPKVSDTISLGNNIAIIAGEVGVMIATALSQFTAAQLLGVDQSRIRQRISQNSLYAITGENNVKVLPRFQFTDSGVLPGLEKVLPVINKDAHPIAVQRFFLTASADLYSKEVKANLSPRDWLIAGHSPNAVARMAADLQTMAKFPEPPGVNTLRKIPPVTTIYHKGALVWRIHFAGGHYPTRWNEFRFYGPTSSRFDHHMTNNKGQGCTQDRGIMYLTINGPACIAEVFQGTRVIDRHSGFPWLAGFELEDDILLLDLTGVFTTALGASTTINSGPKPRAQRWAQQLYDAYPKIDGILYSSSMYGNAESIALFERGARSVPTLTKFHRALNDPAMLAILTETGNEIGYQLV